MSKSDLCVRCNVNKKQIFDCDYCDGQLCSMCLQICLTEKACIITESDMCAVHKKMVGFCMDCSVFACRAGNTHASHNILNLNKAASSIKQLFKSVEDDIVLLQTEIGNYKEACSAKENHMKSIEKRIEEENCKWQQLISSTKQSLLKEIEALLQQLNTSQREKEAMFQNVFSNFQSLREDKMSDRKFLLLWLNFKALLEDCVRHPICVLLSQSLCFLSGLENGFDVRKYFGSLTLDPDVGEDSRATFQKDPGNGYNEKTPYSLQASLYQNSSTLNADTSSESNLLCCDQINITDLSIHLLNFIYKCVCTKQSLSSEDEALLNRTLDNMEMENLSQKTREVIKNVMEINQAYIQAEEVLKQKTKSYMEWINEMNARDKENRWTMSEKLRLKEFQLHTYKCEIDSMSQRIKQLERDCIVAKEDKEKIQQDTYYSLKKVRKDTQENIQKQESQIKQLQNRIKKEEDKVKAAESALLHVNQVKLEKENLLMVERKERENVQRRFEAYVSPIGNQLEEMNRSLTSQIQKKEWEILALQKEKDELQTMLSSIAGDKLTKGNPAITDLSDMNRPLKIAEKYGELYDNEWTDAMEYSKQFKEHNPDMEQKDADEMVVRHLYRILTCCYKESVKVSTEQIHGIANLISSELCLDSDQGHSMLSNFPGYKEIHIARRQNVDRFTKHLIIDEVISAHVIMEGWDYARKNQDLIALLMKTKFYEKCVYLCWSMVIQDPVMYLDEEQEHGSVYDRNVYKEFVSSGDTVDYAVWPALFLHKGGSLLYKGVVNAS